MATTNALRISQLILATTGTQLFVHHRDRIPQDGAVLLVSNHRSFMDAFLLMGAIQRPIRFACHYYMSQVPVLREVVHQLGCFPLEEPDQRQRYFFRQASQLLQRQQVVGVFPEGAQPMVQCTQPQEVSPFQRGFAHLALRAPLSSLAVLPLAIASIEEIASPAFPLPLLSLFDPSEPLFQQAAWHPVVLYRRVNIFVGHPYWITPRQQHHYSGKHSRALVNTLVDYCHTEITSLLQPGCHSQF